MDTPIQVSSVAANISNHMMESFDMDFIQANWSAIMSEVYFNLSLVAPSPLPIAPLATMDKSIWSPALDDWKLFGVKKCLPELRKPRNPWKKTSPPPLPNRSKFCKFCENNGQPLEVYNSHNLKDEDLKVECPALCW